MTRAVRPYLLPPPDAVQFSGWTIEHGGELEPLPPMLPDWDYNTDLALSGVITIDAQEVWRACRLPASFPLLWSVSWRNLDGRVGGVACRTPAEGKELSLAVVVPGNEIGAEVEIGVRLVLGADNTTPETASPVRAGSILWERTSRVVLAGDAARFPVVVLNFGDCGLDPDASWTLDVSHDLEAPVLGGLLLMINETDVALVDAVGRTSTSSLLTSLYEQVACRLLDHAVSLADALGADDWPDGTIGQTLRMLAERYDGGLSALAELRETSPSRYFAALVGEARRNGLGSVLS